MRKRINPNTKHKTQNTKQNPILKIKLNNKKQIWKKKKKEKKKEQTDLTPFLT